MKGNRSLFRNDCPRFSDADAGRHPAGTDAGIPAGTDAGIPAGTDAGIPAGTDAGN